MAKGGGASRPRFRLLPTVLLTVAILIVPAGVYAWGRTSSSFTVRRVDVSGTDIVPQRQVERLLRRDYLGRNLFTVSSRAVRHTLASLSYIADARVDRDFPDVLRVAVVEYVPAMYALSDFRWSVIAADGHVICDLGPATEATATAAAVKTGAAAFGAAAVDTSATASPVPGSAAPTGKAARVLAALEAGPRDATLRLPRIAVAASLKPGSAVKDPGVLDALSVTVGLPHALRDRVAVVQITGKGQLTVLLEGGLLVVWGDTRRSLAKMLALRAVLERYAATGQTCTFADVSVPDRVLARPVLK